MAGFSHAAGPEWAYLASLTGSNGSPIELDSLFVNITVIRLPGAKPNTKIVNLQTLSTKQQDLYYRPNDVTGFSFARLRELVGSDDLDLFFELHEDAAPGVAIPDESSFQRLLLAVRHLGLATPEAAKRIYAPPVLRFFARPKREAQLEAEMLVCGVLLLILWVIFVTIKWCAGGFDPISVGVSLMLVGAMMR